VRCKVNAELLWLECHIINYSLSRYALLGASGCGKTTLLRCILGEYTLENGKIEVLGKIPRTRGHQVPGRDVGYMPQARHMKL